MPTPKHQEKDRMQDRIAALAPNRLRVTCNLARYTENLKNARVKDFVEKIGTEEKTLIERQFRNHMYWMSLMFLEGLSPIPPTSSTLELLEEKKEDIEIFTTVDALQVSLMLFRLLTFTKCLSKDNWLRKGDGMLDWTKDTGEEGNAVLQGSIAGIIDYIVSEACQAMQKINSVEVRKKILTWYSRSINRFYQELIVLSVNSFRDSALSQLEEIWKYNGSISAYYLGISCSGGKMDNGIDGILKEFEFWMSWKWLCGREGAPRDNLRCFDYDVNSRLEDLRMSTCLTNAQKSLLWACSEMCIF